MARIVSCDHRFACGIFLRRGSRPSRLGAAVFLVLLLIGAVGQATASRAVDGENSPAPPALVGRLETLHKQAKEARAKRDYTEVERLRIERRRLIAESSEGTRWNLGLAAIDKAAEAVGRMDYKRASKLLESAWEPFASAPREAVFGDVALELFFANEAARMVDSKEALVEPKKLQECLARAAADDPCQVEAAAALAFLMHPSADEKMRRMDERRSVRDRNERLLAIQRAANEGASVLPWHAPVEYLLAKSSGFVLEDLDCLRGFLKPDNRLGGSNRHGESWSLALGGGILVATTEMRAEKVQSVFQLDSYDTASRSWRRFSPEVIVVSSALSESNAKTWQLGVEDVQKRLKDMAKGLEDEWIKRADERLIAIADAVGRPDVKIGVQQIRAGTWKGGPPPGSPIEAVLKHVAEEFGKLANTATKRPDIDAATMARRDVIAARDQYLTAKALKDRAQDFFQNGMSANDLSALRGLVEETEFSEPGSNGAPPRAESEGLGGFGDAPAPAAPGLQGFQLKTQLLDALSQAEFLAACRTFQMDAAGLGYLTSFNVDAFITGDNAMPGPQRTAALQLKNASQRLGDVFRRLCGGKDANNQDVPPRPLKLADFEAMRLQWARAFESCYQLEVDESKIRALAARAIPFLRMYDVVVAPIVYREKLQSIISKMNRVRSWQIGAVDWNFYDLTAPSASDAAELVDGFRPLILAREDLDAVSKELAESAPNPSAPPLREGSLKVRRPFVTGDGRLDLTMRPSGRPELVVALVERADEPARLGPRAFTDDKGRPTLKVRDGSESLDMRLNLNDGEMVVEYPGLEGHVPIGIAAELEKVSRFIKDRRGYRISVAPEDGPGLFEIVAANDEKISGGYHSIADLVGIDRNIVNSFLPAALLYGPSLPAWQAYREQLLRWSPDPSRVRWAVPRPAFRVNE